MCQQDDKHQPQSAQKGIFQKGTTFGLIFLIAGPFPFYTSRQWRAVKPSGDLFDPLCRGHFDLAGRAVPICHRLHSIAVHTGLHIEIALLIHAGDLPQFGNRFAGNKVGQRDQPIGCPDFQRIKCGQNSVSFRQTHADVDFFIGALHAHCVEQNAARDQLHHGADRRHIGAIAPGLLHIHVNLPVDARQGQGVFDGNQSLCLLKFFPRQGCGL